MCWIFWRNVKGSDRKRIASMATGIKCCKIASRGLFPPPWLLGGILPLRFIGALVEHGWPGLAGNAKCLFLAAFNASHYRALSCSLYYVLFLHLLFSQERLQKNCFLTPKSLPWPSVLQHLSQRQGLSDVFQVWTLSWNRSMVKPSIEPRSAAPGHCGGNLSQVPARLSHQKSQSPKSKCKPLL